MQVGRDLGLFKQVVDRDLKVRVLEWAIGVAHDRELRRIDAQVLFEKGPERARITGRPTVELVQEGAEELQELVVLIIANGHRDHPTFGAVVPLTVLSDARTRVGAPYIRAV